MIFDLSSDIDERDHPFIDREAGRTPEGFFRLVYFVCVYCILLFFQSEG